MRVSEIFYSLSGEGIHAGIPTVFVRLTGCNLRCDYCDTQYAWDGGEEMSVLQIASRLQLNPVAPTLITGGEPLCQSDEVLQLVRQLRVVEIETNGSINPPSWYRRVDCWSVDVKCPSSGSCGTFRPEWLEKLRGRDQLKFVVGTKEDLDFVRGFLNESSPRSAIIVSPIAGILLNKREGLIEEYWNREWLQEVAEFCKERNVRMSLQLHKVIWGDKKGV